MNDLKSGVQKGQVALYVLTGATYYSNFEVRTTPDAPWVRHEPPMPPGTLTKWSLSPSYDALARDPERPLSPSESAALRWQDVEAEPPGLVALYRYREAPHPRVTFQGDFSKRLEPQPGMKLVYARTFVNSARDEVRRLSLGYSDDVSVFLNGRILYRGRSAQGFRDPVVVVVGTDSASVARPPSLPESLRIVGEVFPRSRSSSSSSRRPLPRHPRSRRRTKARRRPRSSSGSTQRPRRRPRCLR